MSSDGEKEQSEILTVGEAARGLNYSEQMVRQLLREGKPEGKKIEGGRRWLIPRGEIDRYLGTSNGPPEASAGQQAGNHHEQELRTLITTWLESVEEVTLDSWLQVLNDHFVSPAGSLHCYQGMQHVPNRGEADGQGAITSQFGKESLIQELCSRACLASTTGPDAVIAVSLCARTS